MVFIDCCGNEDYYENTQQELKLGIKEVYKILNLPSPFSLIVIFSKKKS
jgi:hypothetical protein